MAALDGVHGTVCGAQQYQQSRPTNDLPSPLISCLTPRERIGLAFATEASFISFVSVIFIFFRIGWNVRWYRKTFPKGGWKLFQRPADIYVFSIFVFDIVQAIGGILNLRWAHVGIVTTGHYCTTQGITQQIGEVGVALITLFLAIHTFIAALWKVGLQSRCVALGMVCLACVFITLCVALGAGIHENYETPTPYWCWISPKYTGMRFGGVFIWLWITLFASVMLYIPLYFWTEGRLSVDEKSWFRFHILDPNERVDHQTVDYSQRRAALGMLLHPLAYSVIVVPLSIPRWVQFTFPNVSPAATFFGVTMFNLSGFINVLLFLIARPGLLLFPRPKELPEPGIELSCQEPASAALVDGGSRDSAAPPQVSSSRILDDI